ncbi:MAG: glycosyltransferase family 2 protein [Verrucomicrobia bacterium]|nr:glycosyltransferase family 2 protein [Verrucomicrobiota bacterium]
MKNFIAIILCLGAFQSIGGLEKPFVLVMPSYNDRDWHEMSFDSVFHQKYENYRVICVADGPTDGSEKLIEEYVKENHLENRFTLLKNKTRNGPLACICQAVHLCNKNEIVIDLDNNDWLAHDEVLSYLNQVYQDPDVWMTYGQFIYYPNYRKGFASELPLGVVEQNSFRSLGGVITLPRTFYAGLFQEINKEDFFYDKQFIQKAGDLAYSIPISEMAGKHIKFIPPILYVYNNSHPLNENKNPGNLEEKMDRFIRSKKKYSPLAELPSFEPPSVYSEIEDPLHPSLHDYRMIQRYLSQDKRENIERLGDMTSVVKGMKIIGNTPDELPRSGIVPVNCDENDKENCILIYATFNRGYPKGLKRLLGHIVDSDFKGHVLYRLGGWPDTEGGSLSLAHVPYAFKACFFKEAQRLGYKRVLWLDTSVVPLVSLNEIFKMIEEKGCFVMGNTRMVGPYTNPPAAAYFGLTHQQTNQVPSCSAGLFGVDLTQAKGRLIADWWYRAAYDKDAYFSPRSDQNVLSLILYQLGISDFVPMERMPHSREEIKPDSLFWLDREFVWW